ncbi:MAG: 4-alpha-glucanotransferase [Ginsengibacter sp.]
MTITFYISYHTNPGEKIFLLGNNGFMGDNDDTKALPMQYFNDQYWKVSVELPKDFDDTIHYNYFITREGSAYKTFDGDRYRILHTENYKRKNFIIRDVWNDASYLGNIFFTSAFSKVLLPQVSKVKKITTKNFTHEFRVKAPILQEGETLCLSGSVDSLKNWDETSTIIMTPENNWYVARVRFSENEWPATYKYGIYNLSEKKLIKYEGGSNRTLPIIDAALDITIIHDNFANIQTSLWKGSGVSIPVFSLRSQKSFGVGEFLDIKLLIDWACVSGIQLIQLLPVNDTTAHHTWRDSYPYASISAFALHPLYINLDKVARTKDAAIVKPLKKKQKQLNSLSEFDYEQVMKFKWNVLRELFDAQKKEFKNDVNYFQFFEMNREWLVPYAAFSYLRDKNKTSDFKKWKSHSSYDEDAIQKFVSPSQAHYDEVCFFYFVQYHLHLQLTEVVNYASRKNIVLKGDIPIGIYRYGCDAWENPELYNMNEQAGAPPDDFAVKGQNWGFPTYNWQQMQADNYNWWQRRFDQMSKYFDAFRIDHILGFFRIWSIPIESVEGIMGKFVPAIPVDIMEFGEKNISFDHNRYCSPFLNDDVVWQFFGDNASYVKENYLQQDHDGNYSLRENVNTQVKIQNALNGTKDQHLQQGLFDVVSNVILFEEPGSGGSKFHFRIAMDQTLSYQRLDDHLKFQLQQLYVDYFFRRQNNFWKEESLKKLPQLKRSTNMLVCGEDLGMVPDCVPEVMRQLAILGLEIERMPKNSESRFFHPNDAPYLSIVTPSTHDMSTIRGWWEENRENTQYFYNHMLGHYGLAPYFCEDWINKEIVLQHLYSPAMLAIFQLQDLLGMDDSLRRQNPNDERINVPSDPNHYWHYRMNIDLEKLIKNKGFNDSLRKFIFESGRLK